MLGATFWPAKARPMYTLGLIDGRAVRWQVQSARAAGGGCPTPDRRKMLGSVDWPRCNNLFSRYYSMCSGAEEGLNFTLAIRTRLFMATRMRLNINEKMVISLLRQLRGPFCAGYSEKGLNDLLAELRAAGAAGDKTPADNGVWHGYRLFDIRDKVAEEAAASAGRSRCIRCIIAAPVSASFKGRIFVLPEDSEALLATQYPVDGAANASFRRLSSLPLLNPKAGRIGGLRYGYFGPVSIPRELLDVAWTALPARADYKDREGFPWACRVSAGIMLAAAGSLWILAGAKYSVGQFAWISSLAVGILLSVIGRIWHTPNLLLRNLARWSAVALPAILLDAGTVIICVRLFGETTNTDGGNPIAIGICLSLFAACSLFTCLIFWASSAGDCTRKLGQWSEAPHFRQEDNYG